MKFSVKILVWLILVTSVICAEVSQNIIASENFITKSKQASVLAPSKNYASSEGITVVGKRLTDFSLTGKNYGNAIVLNKAEIEKSGARSVPDLLQPYAGIIKYSNGTGSDLDWTLNWRGFANGDEVAVIVDGIKVNESDSNTVYWPTIPVQDIERIEILPGARSALYGAGSFGGVINIITKKDSGNSLEIVGGSNGYGRQILTLAAATENYYYRVNADRAAADGYRHKSNYNDERYSFKTGWISADTEVNLYSKQSNAELHYPVQLTEDEWREDALKSPVNNIRNIDSALTNLEVIRHLSPEFNLALNLGVLRNDTKFINRSKTNPGSDQELKDSEKGQNYILQLSYANALTVGYEYKLSDIFSKTYSYDRARRTIIQKTASYAATKGEYAPFIQYLAEAGPLYLQYGARQDSVDYVNYDQLAGDGRDYKSFAKRTHSGELGYRFSDGESIYFAYGEAFKAPTFSDLFRSSSAWYLANSDLTAELAKTQEFGFKIKDRTLDFNWSVYSIRVEDEIFSVADPSTFVQTNQNAVNTLRNGFSIQAAEKISDQLTLFGNYNFSKARFQDFQDGWGNDYEGYTVPQSPEEVYSLGLDYSIAQWQINLVQNFVGKQYLSEDYNNEEYQLPAYTFADLRINYQVADNFQVYSEINNLFNNSYRTKGLRWFNSSTFKWDSVFTPADPRSINLGIKWLF